jgi:hypothetical protein
MTKNQYNHNRIYVKLLPFYFNNGCSEYSTTCIVPAREPEYDPDEYNPQWHTNDSPPCNSFGQLMGLTGVLAPDSTTTPTSMVPVVTGGTRPDKETPASLATTPVPIQEEQMGNEFDQLKWSSCDYDGSGIPIGYDGKLWSQFKLQNFVLFVVNYKFTG